MKKGSNDKNLDINLIAYSRGVLKSLFRCSRLKDTRDQEFIIYIYYDVLLTRYGRFVYVMLK